MGGILQIPIRVIARSRNGIWRNLISFLTLNEGGFYGDEEVEGYTLEWDWDDHTIHRKWSCQVGIDHHNGGLPGHKGYIWGEG